MTHPQMLRTKMKAPDSVEDQIGDLLKIDYWIKVIPYIIKILKCIFYENFKHVTLNVYHINMYPTFL